MYSCTHACSYECLSVCQSRRAVYSRAAEICEAEWLETESQILAEAQHTQVDAAAFGVAAAAHSVAADSPPSKRKREGARAPPSKRPRHTPKRGRGAASSSSSRLLPVRMK